MIVSLGPGAFTFASKQHRLRRDNRQWKSMNDCNRSWCLGLPDGMVETSKRTPAFVMRLLFLYMSCIRNALKKVPKLVDGDPF